MHHWAIAAMFCAGAVGMQACARAQPQPQAQRTFDSASDAGAALFDAVQKNDDAALVSLFGPKASALIWSGDAAADKNSRETFVEKYQQMHRVGLDADNWMTLFVGAENWPMPIPLTSQDGKWHFDTDAGEREVLYRRIGRNEEAAIRVCDALVAAEHEYYGSAHDGVASHQYAQHFVSAPGRHDGLFWQDGAGESDSPIGPLLAFAASEEAAKAAGHGRLPFRGYYFRILKAQGANAAGGARDYVVDGHMTDGVAFLAYPAEYRSSGVMTFMVGPDGAVYEKDLGATVEDQASALTTFDPDGTWQRAE